MSVDDQSDLFEIASRSHRGVVREANEDHSATFLTEEGCGLLVADGVSGLHGGGTASRLAVETTLRVLQAAEQSERPEKRLYRAVQRANIVVHDQALAVSELRSMATTLTAVLLVRDQLFAAHIGDCRLYLLRNGRLEQLTRDHTVSAERVRLGVLSKSRALEHPARSTLTRGLGRELFARVDQLRANVTANDTLLVCSDGIHGLLDEPEIADLCLQPSAAGACQALIDAALRRGAPDNVTAAVARASPALRASEKRPGFFQGLKRALGGAG